MTALVFPQCSFSLGPTTSLSDDEHDDHIDSQNDDLLLERNQQQLQPQSPHPFETELTSLDEGSQSEEEQDHPSLVQQPSSWWSDFGNPLPDGPLSMDEEDPTTTNRNNGEFRFGGLKNLGNTCYLNAAIQMLASLGPAFYERLRNQVEEEDQQADSSPLRSALVEILEQLQQGHSPAMEPRKFKKCVDERTSLFLGYLQQDSHEFLTTLLNFLDEDFKKENSKGEDQKQPIMDESSSSDTDEAGSVASEPQQESDDEQWNEMIGSPLKKQRVEDDDGETTALLSTSRSFQDLSVNDIGWLLHGKRSSPIKTSLEPPISPSTADDSPTKKYKLIGGRMDMSGVTLTPLREGIEANPIVATKLTPTLKVTTTTTAELADEERELEKAEADSGESSSMVSPIDSYFTTEVRVCLTCDSCKYRRSHTETYLHLSLEIASEDSPFLGATSASSIQEGLRHFFQPEQRSVKCEKCFYETAHQTTEITKLPRALLFHLKRFIVDVSLDYSNISYRKDQSMVHFDEEMSMESLLDYCAVDVSLPERDEQERTTVPQHYAIRSVVNHIGASASRGHYTADAKRQYITSCDDGDGATKVETGETREIVSQEWTRFNDETVYKLDSPTEAVEDSSRTAYMILYELQ